jgi:hypothetical protein
MSRCSPHLLHIKRSRPIINASTDSPISANEHTSRRGLCYYRTLLPRLIDQPAVL